jgi:hypothetical protein
MPAKREKVTVLLDAALPRELVLKRLCDVGFVVEAHLEEIAAVTGTVSLGNLHALNAIEGVKRVEANRSYQLPPPSSKVQ